MTARRSARPLARRVRVALFVVGAVCIVASAAVFYLLWSQQTLARDLTELERQVGVVASGVAVSEELPGSSADVGGARERLLKVESGLLGVRLAVADARGSVLFSTAGSQAATSYPVGVLVPSGGQFDARSGVLDVSGAGRVAVVAVPVAFGSTGAPSRYLVGARALSDMRAGNSWVLTATAIAGIVGLIVAWLLGVWLTRRVTGPILRLTEGTRAVTAGEWGRQVPVEGDDEVAELAGAFNEMSSRVADTHRSQQEFVADVSHELRTPVASIRGFAEAIADGVVSDEAGVRRSASIIATEATNLAELTSTLLGLAELDAGTITVARERVDVDALAAALGERFRPRAIERGRTLEISPGGGAPIGDPARLLQALSILVDNAVRYTAPGGRVRVLLRGVGDDRWRAEVHDDGPGIPAEDRERVFGRFTRLDASRSVEGGGTGLGLAICRRLVELQGGSVCADLSAELGGALFVVELPGG